MATASGIVRFGSFIGGSISTAAGFAAGAATAPTLRPILQDLENLTWSAHASRPLDAETAAAIVAEDVDKYAWGEEEAGLTGIKPDRFKDLYGETLNAPGLGELYALVRRGEIQASDFIHGLRKAKFESDWDTPLLRLANARLNPAQTALGIVRSLFDSGGLLVGEHDTTGGVVPSTPVSSIDVLKEAQAWGIDKERLRVMVGEIGLPMSLQQAASAYFRNIIKKPDFYLAVAQGDTRPAWADFILDQARHILSANQYAELELRGFLTTTQRRNKTDQYGMSQADSDLLFNLLGRSIPVHQITTGLARGGVYKGSPNDIPDSYLSSLQRGNLRPEYYNLAYANRYTMPSAFVIRGLTQAGTWTEARAEEALLYSGWIPAWAKDTAQAWAKPTGAAADPHVTKAHNSLWTTMVQSYTAGESDAAALVPGFDKLDVPAAARTEILSTLDIRRAIIRKQLTPAQVKKAWQKAAPNEATGQPWTEDDALAALLLRGMSHADATTFLHT